MSEEPKFPYAAWIMVRKSPWSDPLLFEARILGGEGDVRAYLGGPKLNGGGGVVLKKNIYPSRDAAILSAVADMEATLVQQRRSLILRESRVRLLKAQIGGGDHA